MHQSTDLLKADNDLLQALFRKVKTSIQLLILNQTFTFLSNSIQINSI